MLVVTVNLEVLFENLISMLGLAVFFRMITRGEVELHVECHTKCLEEGGHELRALIGGDMQGDSMLGKDIDYKEFGEFSRSDGVMCQNEDALFQ